LVALFFFPSRSKDLLATLAVVVAGYLALFGLMATADYLIRPRHVEQPAEKAEKSQAASRYTLCLEVTAGALAQTSKDPPSVIAQTSRASCEKERHEIFDTFIKYGDNVSPAAITDLQRAFWLKLPQIIAKARG
jgi:hypothetical protein